MNLGKENLIGHCHKEVKMVFLGNRVRGRTFTTKSKSRRCVVDTCKRNHPPWVCKVFEELPVKKRKELIGNANCCYRCLAT